MLLKGYFNSNLGGTLYGNTYQVTNPTANTISFNLLVFGAVYSDAGTYVSTNSNLPETLAAGASIDVTPLSISSASPVILATIQTTNLGGYVGNSGLSPFPPGYGPGGDPSSMIRCSPAIHRSRGKSLGSRQWIILVSPA